MTPTRTKLGFFRLAWYLVRYGAWLRGDLLMDHSRCMTKRDVKILNMAYGVK